MRALAYYCAYCFDKAHIAEKDAEREKWLGHTEILTPIVKAYCSDIAFRVTELAIQVYGGYGYCSEYPVEQFLRDEKIASLYEGANGIQALDLVGRKLAMQKGAYFMNFLGEMSATIAQAQGIAAVSKLAEAMQAAVNTLAEMGMFFSKCGKEGKFLIPIAHAYPFMMMMGKVISGWLLLWEAAIAAKELDAAPKGSQDAFFYKGKVASATYFIRNVLPEVDAIVRAVKSEDLSVMEIPEEAFAS
jgi:hypothetical protein